MSNRIIQYIRDRFTRWFLHRLKSWYRPRYVVEIKMVRPDTPWPKITRHWYRDREEAMEAMESIHNHMRNIDRFDPSMIKPHDMYASHASLHTYVFTPGGMVESLNDRIGYASQNPVIQDMCLDVK